MKIDESGIAFDTKCFEYFHQIAGSLCQKFWIFFQEFFLYFALKIQAHNQYLFQIEVIFFISFNPIDISNAFAYFMRHKLFYFVAYLIEIHFIKWQSAFETSFMVFKYA